MSSQKAYSLIETMVAASIIGILIAGASRSLQHAEFRERHAQVSHQMDLLYRNLYSRTTSPLTLYVTASRSQIHPGNRALSACFLPATSGSSLCPNEARIAPGMDFNTYAIATDEESAAMGGGLVTRIAGSLDNPARYTLSGDLCLPGECNDRAHFTARTWFYSECVENTYRSTRCNDGQSYQSDLAHIYLEVQFVPLSRRSRGKVLDKRWDCKRQKYSSAGATHGSSSRSVLVYPRPSIEDPCSRENFYAPIASEKILTAIEDERCNDNAAVAGYESNGKPTCRCVPPFSPRNNNGQVVVNRYGPLCELNGQCSPNEIFRGFEVFDDNRTGSTTGAKGLRFSTKPLCVPFEYESVNCGESGGRLKDFRFDCKLQCSRPVDDGGGTCRMSCGNNTSGSTCFREK